MMFMGFIFAIMSPGNCNHDNKDDFVARDTGLVDSVDEFGSSWLLEGEPASCGIIKKEEMLCNLLPPEIDPCLTLMNEEIFGKVRTYNLVSTKLCTPALIILSALPLCYFYWSKMLWQFFHFVLSLVVHRNFKV